MGRRHGASWIWCHTERPWAPPALVAQIARAAGLHKDTLKMSYVIVGAPASSQWVEDGRRLFRIVSEPLHTKGRLRYIGCGREGRVGLTLLERHLGPKTARFEGLERGDVIAVTATERKGDGLRLGPDSVVELALGRGQSPGALDQGEPEPR